MSPCVAQCQKEINGNKLVKEENPSVSPSCRHMEMEELQTLHLHPRCLDVQEVEVDGSCLYIAVGVQCCILGLNAVDNNCEDCYGKIQEL